MDSLSQKILVTACYEYETQASPVVCVDPNLYEIGPIERACTVHDVSAGGGQGAPVAVTWVDVDMAGKDRISFDIRVSNVGGGTVFYSGSSLTRDCPNDIDPKDYDKFVANTVREIFHSNLKEFRGLRYMAVYDEIHRILPKFGGSGEGFVQIERGCREFRKWGVGVMLVSQVLSDFVGEIKANINTEIQMRTRDEGDLARVKEEYGDTVIQSLVKAGVGTGMIENAAYNKGKPYFATFRPILHSPVRLKEEELEKYNKYNEDIENLEYQVEQLEKEKVDTFDLKIELKLVKDKLMTGNFTVVDIYLEGLKPRIEKQWNKIGRAHV